MYIVYNLYLINTSMTEKRKYVKPSQRVIELPQCTMLLAGSVQATMDGTWVEEDI